MATPLAPLKILIAYWNSIAPRKPHCTCDKYPDFLQRTDECKFWPKFGCHGNHSHSHEILYTTFEFADPDKLLIMWQIPRFLAQDWNFCNFGLFLPKFGCHGHSLEIMDGIFEFADPDNVTINAKKSSISCAEMKSAISAFLPKFGCHGNSFAPWNFT